MRRLADLRRARLAALGDELLALADEPASLRDLLQERRRPACPRAASVPRPPRWSRRWSASSSPKTWRASISPSRQPVAEVEHVLEREVEREDGLAHLALAGLDLLGDRDLLLAGEERDAAHLLEVHADRIGGLARRALGLLGLGRLLGPLGLGRPSRRSSASAVSSTRLDLDVHVAEHRDDLVELFGAGRLDGCFARLVDRGGRRPGRRPRVPDAGLLLGGSFFHAPHACGGRAGVHQHAQFEIEREPLDDVETGHTPDHGSCGGSAPTGSIRPSAIRAREKPGMPERDIRGENVLSDVGSVKPKWPAVSVSVDTRARRGGEAIPIEAGSAPRGCHVSQAPHAVPSRHR